MLGQRGRILGVRTAPIEEDDAEPWNALPSRRQKEPAIVDLLPKQLQLTLGDQIYIEKHGLPPGLRNRLLRIAAFQNPEFYQCNPCVSRRTTSRALSLVRKTTRSISPCHVGASRRCKTCFPICRSRLSCATNASPAGHSTLGFRANCDRSSRRRCELLAGCCRDLKPCAKGHRQRLCRRLRALDSGRMPSSVRRSFELVAQRQKAEKCDGAVCDRDTQGRTPSDYLHAMRSCAASS